jgi:hypothetical protein
MKNLGKISLFFVYLVSIFGAIDIVTAGIKPTPRAFLFGFALLSFGTQLLYHKRLLAADIAILIFALVSSLGFSLFVSDLIYHPIAVADDCDGHKPSRIHYLDIMMVGFLLTLLVGLVYLKTHQQKCVQDRVFSLLFIIVLVLCYAGISFFTTLNEKIDQVSRPDIVLPSGC